jgi:hypothetical protein
MFFIQQTSDLGYKRHQFFSGPAQPTLVHKVLTSGLCLSWRVSDHTQIVAGGDAIKQVVTGKPPCFPTPSDHTPVDQIIYSVITAPIRRQYHFGHYVFRWSIFFMILSAH